MAPRRGRKGGVGAITSPNIRIGNRPFRHKPPILAGLLATTSVWTPDTFAANLIRARYDLDLGCCLEHGAFEDNHVSSPDESLVFFIIRLLDRLRAMGTAPAVDWSQYFK